MAATVLSNSSALSDELLQSFGEQAPKDDRENRFCSEDFEDLRLAGYLEIAVPAQFGGPGLNLAQVCLEQRLLASHARTRARVGWKEHAGDSRRRATLVKRTHKEITT